MAFGIAMGLGLEKVVGEQLLKKLVGLEDILTNVIRFSFLLLENQRAV